MPKEMMNDAVQAASGPTGAAAVVMPGCFLTADQKKKYSDFKRTKLIATSLFLLMLVGYCFFKYFEHAYPWLGYFRAFTEAGMVGALADWFAVTALFRYPLGIRLPHTAIIPNNKERIGENIGDFVELNFFAADTIDEKLRSKDLTKEIAEWCRENTFVIDDLCLVIPHVLNAIADRDIRRFVRENILSGIRSVDLAPLLGNLLAALTAGNRLQDHFDSALKIASRLFHAAKPYIREKISEQSPWYMKIFGVDYTIYDRIITSVEEELERLTEPGHALRTELRKKNEELIAQLKSSPEYKRKVEELRDAILNNGDFIDYLDNAWNDIRPVIDHDVTSANSQLKSGLVEAMQVLCRGLLQDASVRDKMNKLMRDILTGVMRRHPRAISTFINREVSGWDTGTLIQQTEIAIGSDLQFIRINGTVIGGLVGLLIYVATRLLF
jgi:uncharacterized membrane-anchored protein YjiN (DUF445 family)